jgi:DNA repair protein RecO
MKQTTVETAIVIKASIHREADIRVTLLTPAGTRVLYATGAAKGTAKLKNAVQLFTVGEYTIAGSKIMGAHIIQGGMKIAREINRYYLACAMCEILAKLDDSQNWGQIFYLTARSLQSLEGSEISAYKVFINFFTKLLVLLGYDVVEFSESELIEQFKQTEDPEIDEIEVGLVSAKKCVQHLNATYVELLDMSIPCAREFLS